MTEAEVGAVVEAETGADANIEIGEFEAIVTLSRCPRSTRSVSPSCRPVSSSGVLQALDGGTLVVRPALFMLLLLCGKADVVGGELGEWKEGGMMDPVSGMDSGSKAG
jgi:hypothetical protein